MNLRVVFWYYKVDTNHEIRNHCKYKRNRKVLLVFTNPANLSLNCQKKKCAYFKTNLRTHECLKMRNAHIPLSSFHGWYIECLVVFFMNFYQALQFDALRFKNYITIGHFFIRRDHHVLKYARIVCYRIDTSDFTFLSRGCNKLFWMLPSP